MSSSIGTASGDIQFSQTWPHLCSSAPGPARKEILLPIGGTCLSCHHFGFLRSIAAKRELCVNECVNERGLVCSSFCGLVLLAFDLFRPKDATEKNCNHVTSFYAETRHPTNSADPGVKHLLPREADRSEKDQLRKAVRTPARPKMLRCE